MATGEDEGGGDDMALKTWKMWFTSVVAASLLAGCGGKPRIGLVLSVGGRGDKSFNDSAYAGLMKAAQTLGVTYDVREPMQVGEMGPFLRELAETKPNLVIAVGFLQKDAVEKTAKDFPDVRFAIIDSVVDAPNVASLVFREEEGSYLVGAIAGLTTKSQAVGFVGGMRIPLIAKFEAGFTDGVHAVNPGARVLVDYVGVGPTAFNDPDKGKAVAARLFARGADIIYHAAGGSGRGVIDAAAEKKKLAIGVDSNQNGMRPGSVLTSMEKHLDTVVYDVIQRVVEKRFSAGMITYGVKEGGVDFALDANNEALLAPAVLQKASQIREGIIAGRIKVRAA